MSRDNSRIALFIDGANFYATSKALGFDTDYRKLLTEFSQHGKILRAFYYTIMIDDQDYSSIRPLVDWLDYNGFNVVTKPAREYTDHQTGRRKFRGNMDVELAIDAIEISEHVGQVYLFTGDSDFRALVGALQRRGVRVTVVSTVSTQPAMIADELRRAADEFIDVATIAQRISRPQNDRLPRFVRGPEGDDDA